MNRWDGACLRQAPFLLDRTCDTILVSESYNIVILIRMEML